MPGKKKKKENQKPSSVHLGELAGATTITEDTKELLTRSFCGALRLLMWTNTHNPEPPLHWAGAARVALMVWCGGESAGAQLPPPAQSCAAAGAAPLGPTEPPFNLNSWTESLQTLQ